MINIEKFKSFSCVSMDSIEQFSRIDKDWGDTQCTYLFKVVLNLVS